MLRNVVEGFSKLWQKLGAIQVRQGCDTKLTDVVMSVERVR